MGLVRRKDQRRQRETLAASRMASAEKFCLRWNDFESNISVAFRELREEKDFFDVTLACEDSQISAHKVILSACSPFFRRTRSQPLLSKTLTKKITGTMGSTRASMRTSTLTQDSPWLMETKVRSRNSFSRSLTG